jgi:hypothetical protein
MSQGAMAANFDLVWVVKKKKKKRKKRKKKERKKKIRGRGRPRGAERTGGKWCAEDDTMYSKVLRLDSLDL